jgi:hypothetical protein
MKFKCPACDDKCISLWKKYWLTPFKIIDCDCCNSKIGLPSFIAAVISAIHYLIALYLGYLIFIYQSYEYILLFLLAWLVFDIIQLFLPLVRRRI